MSFIFKLLLTCGLIPVGGLFIGQAPRVPNDGCQLADVGTEYIRI